MAVFSQRVTTVFKTRVATAVAICVMAIVIVVLLSFTIKHSLSVKQLQQQMDQQQQEQLDQQLEQQHQHKQQLMQHNQTLQQVYGMQKQFYNMQQQMHHQNQTQQKYVQRMQQQAEQQQTQIQQQQQQMQQMQQQIIQMQHQQWKLMRSSNITENATAGAAFYVGSSAFVRAGTSNIVFDTVITNTLDTPYNTTINLLTSVPDNCVYWFQLSVGVPAYTPTNTRLNGLPYPVAVVAHNTAYAADVIVTDTIQNVNTSAQLSVSNLHALFGTYNYLNLSYIGTSVLGFRIDNIMSPQVYFSVQCTCNNQPKYTLINFNRVLVNAGNAWNKISSHFKAPYTGNYFFSFAVSTAPVDGYVVLLVRSFAEYLYFRLPGVVGSGAIMARSAVMLSLSFNDVVSFATKNVISSTTDAQGFYYSPVGKDPTAGVAWSVAHYSAFSGPITELTFNTVYVNMQYVWNTITNKATIPVAGMYLIDLTISFHGCGTGEMRVLVNSQPINTIRLSLHKTEHTSLTRSRSVIVSANVGDQLQVVAILTAGIRHYSASFVGLRLF